MILILRLNYLPMRVDFPAGKENMTLITVLSNGHLIKYSKISRVRTLLILLFLMRENS